MSSAGSRSETVESLGPAPLEGGVSTGGAGCKTQNAACPAPAAAGGGSEHTVLLFYKYCAVPDVGAVADLLEASCNELDLTGRILLASEGINSNLAGSAAAVDVFCQRLEAHPLLGGIDFKLDTSTAARPFPDLVIKQVDEIVSTAGTMPFALLEQGYAGTHLSPAAFHDALTRSYNNKEEEDGGGCKTVILDVRNRKEFALGHFEGAVDPDIKNQARWVPDYAEKSAEQWAADGTKVLMYCTGGIRCEKASAYLRSKGVADVSQLSGGIHRYLEEYGSAGHFAGANFVFDSRGQQKLAGAAVVGRCTYCQCPEDTITSDRVCAVCRDAVLVCDACRGPRRGVYFCSDHAPSFDAPDFKNVLYHAFLDPFTEEDLAAQKAGLEALCAKGGIMSDKTFRRRRRAVSKKCRMLDARMKVLKEGGATIDEGVVIRCRSCSRPSSFAHASTVGVGGEATCCVGECWGFHRDPEDADVTDSVPDLSALTVS